MPEVKERNVYSALLKCKGSQEISIGSATINISLNPMDIHDIGSPDIILWLEASIKLFGQHLNLKVPIPVEAEKGGIYGGALDDLRKFVERKKHIIEIPMLVVAEAGYDKLEENESFPVQFLVRQIPIRALSN